MNFKKVSANSGLAWLTEGVSLVAKNPVVFFSMALILAAISLVPLLGSLAMAIFGPALLGGILYGLREQEQGRTAEVGQLFRAFQEPGKIGPMLVLCIPAIVAGVIAAGLAFIFIGGIFLAMGMASAHHAAVGLVMQLGSGLLLLILLLAVCAAVAALTFFAVPRVMFDDLEPLAAMRESFTASWHNIGTMLVYVGVLLAAVIVVAVALSMVSKILAGLIVSVMFYPVVAAASFVAYQQVFSVDSSPSEGSSAKLIN